MCIINVVWYWMSRLELSIDLACTLILYEVFSSNGLWVNTTPLPSCIRIPNGFRRSFSMIVNDVRGRWFPYWSYAMSRIRSWPPGIPLGRAIVLNSRMSAYLIPSGQGLSDFEHSRTQYLKCERKYWFC